VTPPAELRIAHTADLDAATHQAARALLDDVFDDMADEDWDHALGGMHALLWESAELIGHASVIQRQLLYGGAWRTGYVEVVAVRADRRRSGHGATMMDALARIIRGAQEPGARPAKPGRRQSARIGCQVWTIAPWDAVAARCRASVWGP
jgi:aminoglycoside 2'-N-acetyltransferase I